MAGTAREIARTSASTEVENLLRLAWEAEVEGRPRLRDALMTLVVAESGPEDAVLSERCRRSLVARQPDHWFGTGATLGQILANNRVAGAISKLRAMFPPVRVQRMLLRYEAQRGAFTGGRPPLEKVLEDLHLMPAHRRAPQPVSVPVSVPKERPRPVAERPRALPFPSKPEAALISAPRENDPDGSVAALYVTVLMAMAVLLRDVMQEESSTRGDSRAA